MKTEWGNFAYGLRDLPSSVASLQSQRKLLPGNRTQSTEGIHGGPTANVSFSFEIILIEIVALEKF